MEEKQQGISEMELGHMTLLLEGWPAAGRDPPRRRQGGRRLWDPVPVYQHCLCSWYVFDKLF